MGLIFGVVLVHHHLVGVGGEPVVGVGVIAGLEGLTSCINTVWREISHPRPAGYNSGDSLWVSNFGW